MDISKVSDDELRQEVDRRKIALTKPLPMVQYSKADMEKIEKACIKYIEIMAEDLDANRLKTLKQLAFEAAIDAFYGSGVWEWINKRIAKMEEST